MSSLRLYNTLSRKVETFIPQNPDNVKVYTCGPTVYSAPHIGNFAAYIYWDLLVRTLGMNGFTVRRVLNFTDVGHLVSDADDGEDKLEKGARISGKTVWEVADYYTEAFMRDFKALNLVMPQVLAPATKYIEADMSLVEILSSKGYTYETRDGVYFDTSRFPRYADFAKLDLEGLRAGARVEFSDEKRNPSDFAVWKFIQPEEKHEMRWDYLGRPGYPGWHLECSSIIHTELGETIDIHTGGIDHIPVHHTNEIAQSEAAYEQKLSNYWLHCHHLTADGQKMSKSLGNIYTLDDLAQNGFSPLDYKMWILMGSYMSERDFNLVALASAHTRRRNWQNQILRSHQLGLEPSEEEGMALDRVQNALNDNLNSPQAFAEIDMALTYNLSPTFWRHIEELFGLGLFDGLELAPEVTRLLEERAAARKNRDFAASDELRDELLSYGISVLDTPSGQIWQLAG